MADHPLPIPENYRIEHTDRRVVDAGDNGLDPKRHLTRRGAAKHATERNALRLLPSYEWRPVRVGRWWRIAAYQNVLVPEDVA